MPDVYCLRQSQFKLHLQVSEGRVLLMRWLILKQKRTKNAWQHIYLYTLNKHLSPLFAVLSHASCSGDYKISRLIRYFYSDKFSATYLTPKHESFVQCLYL